MNKFLFILAGGFLFALAADGAQIFSDDFETPGLFVENWKAHGALAPTGGTLRIESGKSITSKGNFTGKNYAVEVVMTESGGEPGGHCGIQLDGISFMLRGDARWGTAYRPAGMARSMGRVGTIANWRKGDPVRFRVERRTGKEFSQYSFFVNGEGVQSFREAMPDSGTFSIYGYHLDPVLESVTVESLDPGDDSPNAAVNSSFEHLQEGMPLFVNAQTPRTRSWNHSFEEFFESFTTDTTEKHSGERSLKLVRTDACPKNGFLTHDSGCAKGKPVTGSVWLKADRPLAAELILWEKHGTWNAKRVNLTTDWKRYSFSVMNPQKSVVCFGMNFTDPGTVWADDVQIEPGTEATEWKPSSLDREKFSPRTAEAESAKEYALPFRGDSLHPDSLDAMIAGNPLRIDEFLFKGQPSPANRTEAYLLAGKDSLLIGIRAFVKDVSKIKTEPRPHDHGRIFGDDCVEILMDPALTRGEYLHFAVNASGSRADMGFGRNPAWNGDWNASAKINPETKSIDYLIEIPYRVFASDRLSDVWGFNIGRNCTESNQCSSLLKTPYLNFHLPQIYPTLRWRKGVLDPYRIGFPGAGISPDGKIFSVRVRNLGSASGKAGLVLRKPDGTPEGETSFELAPGEKTVAFPAGAAEGFSFLSLSANGIPLASALVDAKRNNPVTAFFGQSFYMNEKTARLFGTANLPGSPDGIKGTLAVAGKTFPVSGGSRFRAEIPLDGIPVGTHEAVLTFPGAVCRFPLKKLEWNAQSTPVDTYSRALMVDGKPVFVVAPFFGVPKTHEETVNTVKLYRDAGFRFLMPGSHHADAPLKDFLAECGKSGISTLIWTFGGWKNRENLDPKAFFASLPDSCVRGFLMVDEPELYAKSDEVKTYMEKLRSAMPRVPVFMNNTALGIPSKFAGLATDIVMLDDYLTNSETRTLGEMVDSSDRVFEAGTDGRKPGFFFHAGGNLHNHYREPSCAEQVAQGYSAVVTGLSGIAYFDGVPSYPGDWEGMKRFNAEVRELEPVLFSKEENPVVTCSAGGVRFQARSLEGKVYVIALNISKTPVKAEFTLEPGLVRDGDGKVLFDDRSMPVSGGKFSDSFGPLERRVYCFRKGGK